MSDTDKKKDWLTLADKIYAAGRAIFDEADMIESELGAKDPKVLSLALLCRTMGSFEGAIAMIEHGLIVEARTLTRCCWENLIWIDGLVAKGNDFVKEVIDSEIASKQKRGKVLLELAVKQPGKSHFEKLEAYLAELKEKFPKTKLINFKSTADSGTLKEAYVFYGALSSDAAHPSASSLGRHISWKSVEGQRVVNLEAQPAADEEEIVETLDFSCAALLGVCVGTNQILGGVPAGESLAGIFDELRALRQPERTPS